MNGSEKTMPNNIEAEEFVLGAMMIDPEIIPQVLEIVSPGAFYRDKNRRVSRIIQDLFHSGQPVNQVTVAERLKMKGELEILGGMDYLSYLVMNTPPTVYARSYAEVIKQCSRQRTIISISDTIVNTAATAEPDEIIADAVQKFLALKQDDTRGPKLYGELALDYYGEFQQWVEGGFKPQGLSTGFSRLDTILGGMRAGNLIIVAGRPSMGKTNLLLQMAKNFSHSGNKSLFFSLEMNYRELIHRLVFSEARLPEQELRGEAGEGVSERLKDIYSSLLNMPLWIDDSPSTKTRDALTHTLSLMVRENVKAMFFDHVSLAGDVLRNENEVQRLGFITKGLKSIARICNIPVIVASQLSREVAKIRSSHKPWLEDLRGSGELEQNADVVLGLYRPEYYFPKDDSGNIPAWSNFLEVEILKQRQGKANPRGYVSTGLYYDVTTGFMDDWAGDFPEVEQ